MLKAVADTHQSAHDGKKCHDHEGNQHHHWSFVRLSVAVSILPVGGMDSSMLVNLRAPIVSPKRHEQQTEHIERSEEGGDDADQPINPTGLISLPEDFILAPESRERRDSGNGQ